ncbi:hypothetical protein LXA43DRAFT_1093639 [Ganoderma leucocontextum]|nr:hypothetical protein LXA43DRAFT_1093639 [Ganoderma leucocontextum]
MSISRDSCESSLSDLDTPSDRQLEDWMNELEDHVHVFPGNIESFLSVFVPSSAPKMSKPVSQAAFSKYKPKDLEGKDNKRRYANLLYGLRATVSSFPDDKKPQFWRHQLEEMPFPFPEFTSNHINTNPDLSVSFPGSTSHQPDWQHIALFIYVEPDEANDPFGESTPEHRAMVVELATGARGLMTVHNHCAAFSLVIYDHWARIARFDRSCAVVSPAFSLKRNPRYLQEFFWRLFHPRVGQPIVGCDPTVRKLTQGEERWLVYSLGAAHETAPSNLAMCRRVEAWTPCHGRDGVVPKAYFVVALLNLNAHLMSPATIVNASITVVVVKDAWRQLARRSEQDFFARIEQAIPEGQRVGLPARVIGCDLGDTEVQQWRHETGKDLRDAFEVQTCTRRIIDGPDSFHRERSHVRTVTSTIGRPLSEFKDTRQLCQAVRDAIAAHKDLWENARILHRDISIGNVRIIDTMITVENRLRDSVGCLYDFDYSSMVENLSAADKDERRPDERPLDDLKERTEMDYFTAIELLERPGTKHEVHHDLESFLWVLLWIVLHHTDHTHPGGSKASSLIFADIGWTRATLKRGYLFDETSSAGVRNNDPLSQLITGFKRLAHRSVGYRGIRGELMTHDEVLEIFDVALARTDWPPTDMDGPKGRRS